MTQPGASMPIRLALTVSTLIALFAAAAAAEPSTTVRAVNLRAAAAVSSAVVGKIPSGSAVSVTKCGEWCEVEWQGQRGFVIANAFSRAGVVPARAAATRDPFATDLPLGPVPTSAGSYQAPERTTGPYVGGAANGSGRGVGWLGYRGRW
jgi:uncharacterized protein YraI